MNTLLDCRPVDHVTNLSIKHACLYFHPTYSFQCFCLFVCFSCSIHSYSVLFLTVIPCSSHSLFMDWSHCLTLQDFHPTVQCGFLLLLKIHYYNSFVSWISFWLLLPVLPNQVSVFFFKSHVSVHPLSKYAFPLKGI